MREIKFRGKTENGNWLVGDLMTLEHFVADSKSKFQIGDFKTGVVFDVNKDTVGQYTGLKDKNGKEIYEGDIIQYLDITKGLIKYSEEYAQFVLVDTGSVKDEFEPLGDYNVKVFEIIGNKFDNPELLWEENKC